MAGLIVGTEHRYQFSWQGQYFGPVRSVSSRIWDVQIALSFSLSCYACPQTRETNGFQNKEHHFQTISAPYGKWRVVPLEGVMRHTTCYICYVPFSAHVSDGTEYIPQYTT